jgi:hypothetical protein
MQAGSACSAEAAAEPTRDSVFESFGMAKLARLSRRQNMKTPLFYLQNSIVLSLYISFV